MLPGTPPPVLAGVVVGTGVALAAEPRGLLARLRLIVPQHISSLCTGGQRAGVRVWRWTTPKRAGVECREGKNKLLGTSLGAEVPMQGLSRASSFQATGINQEGKHIDEGV